MKVICCYLLFINILAGIVFVKDKWCATHNRKRVSETNLHILEALGGIFLIMTLIPIIRHKNRKKSYCFFSVLILLLWIIILWVWKAQIFVP